MICPNCKEEIKEYEKVGDIPHLEYWEDGGEGEITCPHCEHRMYVVKHIKITYDIKGVA